MDFSLLATQISGQDWIEWLGLITGILYVFLAAYERPSCWVFGIISCAAIAWKSFTDYRLMADGMLQLFYIIIGFAGLWQWLKGQQEQQPKPVVTSPLKTHLLSIGLALLMAVPASWFLIQYASARYGYMDTVLTFLSIYATLLLVRKDLHNWVYWIFIDVMYVVLYLKSEGYLFALLFLVYAVMSVWGYLRWKKGLLRI